MQYIIQYDVWTAHNNIRSIVLMLQFARYHFSGH